MFLYQLQRACYYPESYPTVSLLSSLKLFMQWLGVPLSGMLQKGLCSWVNLMTASIPFATKILWFPVHSVSSVQFSRSVISDFVRPHGLQHTRLPCPSPTPRAWSNSCPLSRWCHPAISSSVIPFSFCLQSFPVSGSFPMCQFFQSGGQSIGASALASVLPMNIQDWFSLGLTSWISLQLDLHISFMSLVFCNSFMKIRFMYHAIYAFDM